MNQIKLSLLRGICQMPAYVTCALATMKPCRDRTPSVVEGMDLSFLDKVSAIQ